MAKCRIGHFAEAQILQELEVDYIDESEVLTPADVEHHVDKWLYTVPFVCGATNLGEALRRISEGAAMIRTKGEAGTGDIVNAVTHMRAVFGAIRGLQALRERRAPCGREGASSAVRLVRWVAENGRLPGRDLHRRRHRDSGRRVALHAARRGRGLRRLRHLQVRPRSAGRSRRVAGRRRPPVRGRSSRRRRHFDDAKVLADVSTDLGQPMVGIFPPSSLPDDERLEVRGW